MKAFTDISQSKKLAEILPLESADMTWYKPILYDPFELHTLPYSKHFMAGGDEKIPCWSLAALLDVLTYPHIEQNYMGQWFCRVEQQNTTYLWEGSNPVDACYELILKLHERELL